MRNFRQILNNLIIFFGTGTFFCWITLFIVGPQAAFLGKTFVCGLFCLSVTAILRVFCDEMEDI